MERELVLPHLIARRAEETPDRPAVQCVDGTEMTFRELHEQSQLWADAYRRLGVAADEHVATMLPHSFDSYLAWLGVAWLRAVEVPTNTGYLGEMLRYLLADSQARVLVIAAAYLERLAAVADRLTNLEVVVVPDLGPATIAPPPLPFRVLGRDEFLAGATPARDLPGPEYHDVSAVIYTSGTTGASKGVLVPWAGLYDLNGMLPSDIITGADSGYYSVYPAYHVAGKAAMYAAYVHGARLVFRESFSLSNYWDDIRRYDCEFGGLVGPMVAMMLAEPERPDDALTPLKGVVMAPVLPAFEEFKRRFGVRVCTGFGMTEIGYPFASGWELTDHTTVGRLRTNSPGFEARIVNDLDEDLGPNQLGELVVRTREPWVITSGYYNMPDKTAAAWRNGWFHTGDGFMRDDDGNYFFLDRVKDALRRRGENISSFEVEVAINAHPAVLESAAIGVPSELSEDEVKIVIVLQPGATLDPAELIGFLIPRMPRFMIPRFVEIVDGLPKTPATQRVQKYELRQNARNANTWDREAAGIALPR